MLRILCSSPYREYMDNAVNDSTMADNLIWNIIFRSDSDSDLKSPFTRAFQGATRFCGVSVVDAASSPSLYPLLGYYELSFSVYNNQIYSCRILWILARKIDLTLKLLCAKTSPLPATVDICRTTGESSLLPFHSFTANVSCSFGSGSSLTFVCYPQCITLTFVNSSNQMFSAGFLISEKPSTH